MRKPINSPSIFKFKITLNDSTPRVWRRILAPADYTFFDLHCAIQNAMGWTDSHLHAFYIGDRYGRERITVEFPNPDNDWPEKGETRDERTERLADYFGKIVKQCVYCYDFGDNWGHTILFEGELPRDHKIKYPRCLDGANACPPDDCGGVGGYDRLQKTLKNSNDPEHDDMLAWLGLEDPADFNSNEFNPEEVEFEDPKKRLKEWNKGFGI
ncbi:MAG: plasmid pRiA4b ORF-3 family protein [bacterium]|nr:plasmid pRiA4b ORF-3 family protein [bacterium]